MNIYLYRHDEETGPFPETEVRNLVASGQIKPTCLARREGVQEWLPLEQVMTLAPQPLPTGLPPLPPRDRVRTQTSQAPLPPVKPSSTIRTLSGVFALILGLLAVFNIGGCINAQSKLAKFQSGDNAQDGLEMLVDTARGMNQGDPLRGVSGLLDKSRSLQEDRDSCQLGAWLCLAGAGLAGGVYGFSRLERQV